MTLAVAPAALACGICVEDKVAATYDYGVVTHAAALHHLVVFAAVDGPGDAAARARSLERAAGRLAGVDRASVRTAASPRALSFALDPRAATPESALAKLEREPSLRGVRLTLIKVMR
jgi:hypothetical protein